MITFHFLNVGKGDCTIIEHPSGRVSMVDIYNAKTLSEDQEKAINAYYSSRKSHLLSSDFFLKTAKASLQDPIEYYKNIIGDKPIFRFIATHPDMDHLSGLYRLVCEEKISILNFWHNNHRKDFEKQDFNNSPYNYNDWQTYKELQNGKYAKSLIFRQGAGDKYFNKDDKSGSGDNIYVWAPNEKLEKLAKDQEDYNHVSYVLSMEHAGNKVIFGGDAYGNEDHHQENSWKEIANWLGEKFDMSSAVLKASHHGHENGYHTESVKRMGPKYTIISDSYGNDGIRADLYRQWSRVLSTFWCGNIIIKIDDFGTVNAYTQNNRFDSSYTDPFSGYFLVPE